MFFLITALSYIILGGFTLFFIGAIFLENKNHHTGMADSAAKKSGKKTFKKSKYGSYEWSISMDGWLADSSAVVNDEYGKYDEGDDEVGKANMQQSELANSCCTANANFSKKRSKLNQYDFDKMVFVSFSHKRVHNDKYGECIKITLSPSNIRLPKVCYVKLHYDNNVIKKIAYYHNSDNLSKVGDARPTDVLYIKIPERSVFEKILRTKKIAVYYDANEQDCIHLEDLVLRSYKSEKRYEDTDDLYYDLRCSNGYLREKSLKKLSSNMRYYLDDKVIFKILLLRVNDWVPEVRKLALTVANKYIKNCESVFLMLLLKDIWHLKNCGRANLSGFIKNVELHLIKKEEKLQNMVFFKDSILARNAYMLLAKYGKINEFNLLIHNNKIKDIIILSRLSLLIPELSKQNLLANKDLLLSSNSKEIRKQTLSACAKYDLNKKNLIEKFLLDKSKTVAEMAWYLSRKNDIDAICIYKNVLLNSAAYSYREIKAVCAMSSYLSLKVLIESIVLMIDRDERLEVKRCAIKYLLELDVYDGINKLLEMIVCGKKEESILAANYFYKIHSTGKVSINRSDICEAVSHTKYNESKKILLALISKLQSEIKFLIYLQLFELLGEVTFRRFGLSYELSEVYLAFELSEKHKQETLSWLKRNPNKIKMELNLVFSKSRHNRKFLQENLELQF